MTISELQAFVSDYYGRQLRSSADLQTNACCAVGAPPSWLAPLLEHIHPDVTEHFYGCGFPIPPGLSGLRALDMGCGSGRDVYLLAQLVGAQGHVWGLDMTAEQLRRAQDTAAWHADRFGYSAPNTTFCHGYIEDLRGAGIADNRLDLIVSNCVVNLSPRKDLVLAEAYRTLAPGGEFYLSDVFADRRLPLPVAQDPILYAECLGGALYQGDFVSLAKKAGFLDPRVVSRAPVTLQNPAIQAKVGAARFYSVTYRLLKLEGLDDQCEDYGQSATYRGGIPGAEAVFWLDDHHAFERGRPERICANTAAMLSQTRFARWFEVTGGKETHFGLYPCGPTLAAAQYTPTPTPAACC